MRAIRPLGQHLSIRAVLLIGFGLTLALWLISGYSLTRRVADVQRQSATTNRRYMRSQELLSTVRTQVLLGAVYVRDALLDPAPGATVAYRAQLEAALQLVDRALAQYEPILDSQGEIGRIAALRAQVAEFRSTVLDVLATDSSRWPSEARLLLRDRIMPRREAVIRISEEVQALNRTAFVEQRLASARIYADIERRIWTQFGVALVFTFLIGFLATRQVGALERTLRAQQARDAANTRDLQRLSSQLMTVQEEERRTIARDLHDEVGQALTAIKVELALAQRGIETGATGPALLDDARRITDGALHSVRDISRLLHPGVLDDLGLPAAVEAYIRDFRRRHDLTVDLLLERMDERLPQPAEVAAYRIVQEALTNVARHARATTCRVYLQRLPHTVLITIEDDGIGLDAPLEGTRHARTGLGLLGIRERATQLGGTVRFESAPNQGTRITVELPVAPLRPSGHGTSDPAPEPSMPTLGAVHA